MNPVTMVRLFFVADALGWAIVLIQRGSTFGLSRSYDGMARIMGEDAWAAFFLLVALLLLTTLRASRRYCLAVSTGVFLLHAWIAVEFARSSGMLSTGAITHANMALMPAAWLFIYDFWTSRRVVA